ncbi:hypothetical protein [Dyadobacter psychrotolerans]|uniref:Uncharacterized protein n=1 Tax=Dyadobacter psychrotolerans TaxID=2541721 RepID=A0A4R5DXR8_9BACT|nr:hypothetical protein [Dyadobacter psychrotolerans]TDE16135.1 hypothetical protein E0F88_07710 [Dyadobacter psychrotolerans]
MQTKWFHYLLAFFAGIFLVNTLPHYIHGITGKAFPTPFADPPGKGTSSPAYNVLWAMINFLIGFAIIYFVKLRNRSKFLWIAFFLGAVTMSFYLASYFGALTFE